MRNPVLPDTGLHLASQDLLGSAFALPFLLILSYLLPAGPFTAVGLLLLLAGLVTSPATINAAALRIVLPFLLMCVWGTVMGWGHDQYDLLKDLWYGLKVALCLMLGFLIGARATDTRRPMEWVIWLALASSLWSIATFVRTAGGSIDTIGLEGFEHLSLACVAALPLLHARVVDEPESRLRYLGIGAVIVFAIVLSSSRTTIVAAAMMMLASFGLFASWKRVVVAVVLVVGAMYLLRLVLPDYSGGELTLAVKFRRSLDEILLTDNADPLAMMMNWRGFEAYNAQLLFDQSPFLQKVFGNGYGTLVDLGIEIIGADGTVTRFQPTLHNGYYYILIKYGVVGILTYLGTLLWYIYVGRRSVDAMSLEDRMLRGLVVSVLFATLVVTGLYNKGALQDMTVLLGWFVGQGCRYRFDRQPQPVPTAWNVDERTPRLV